MCIDRSWGGVALMERGAGIGADLTLIQDEKKGGWGEKADKNGSWSHQQHRDDRPELVQQPPNGERGNDPRAQHLCPEEIEGSPANRPTGAGRL